MSDEDHSALGGQRSPVPSVDDSDRWPSHWLRRVHQLSLTLSGVTDPLEAARSSVEQALRALAADAGGVLLLSPDGDVLRVAHASGYSAEELARWSSLPLAAQVPATDAFRSGEPALIHSYREMADRYPSLATDPITMGHQAWAALPLRAHGVCIGVFALGFRAEQAFAGDELGFLRVVADQCAQALQRTLLVERDRRSTARLRVLAEASRVFSAARPDLAAVLDAIAEQVVSNLGSSCSIALVSPDGEWLDAVTIRDRDPSVEMRLRAMASSLRIRRGEGLSGGVLASGRSLLIPRVAPGEIGSRTVAKISGELEAFAVRSLLIAPLTTSGRRLGIISTSRYSEDPPFTDDDRTLLEELADRAALAIENARLHEGERQARALAEEADRRKDEFVAMLGHELRNPLAPLRVGVEIMRQLPPDDSGVTWAREMIARQVEQLARLVGDLLDVSRINLGRIALALEPLDLAAIASAALEASRPLLAERKHEVAFLLPPAAVRVRGDAVRLTQVISNLLNNAGKYTDSGGRISVSVGTTGSEATVTVADSGIGIPPQMLDRIFDPFTQVDHAGDRSGGGLGIGLTLARRLVEMHGGAVHASSAGAGLGSTFVVKLPLLKEEGPLVARDAPAPPSAPPHPRRILVAEDNADTAESLRRVLAMQGHQVEVANHGLDALERADRMNPDVVLLDIGLPGLDGLEVARRLRGRGGPGRPVLVAITGLGREVDRRRTADAGFDHHLVKPIDLASLRSVLTR